MIATYKSRDNFFFFMLDDLDLIEKIDKSGMLDTVANFPDHIVKANKLAEDISVPEREMNGIVVSGMGGSAISGDIVKEWLRDRIDVPLIVNRDYDLPKWVGEDTLAIFLSYSGNTEETLSSFMHGIKRKALCIAISSGGKLERICKEKDVPHIKIPSGFQPRAATAFLLFPTIRIIQKAKAIDEKVEDEIKETIDVCRKISKNNKKNVPTHDNLAKSIATEICSTFPHIYGWRYYVPIARRWRTQINENSKMLARLDEVPECNHNDIVGWTKHREISSVSSCILLKGGDEPDRIAERYNFMEEVFKDAGAKVIEVHAMGKGLLSRMISLMYMGDFVSCYLAILRKVDPTPVDVITKLKERLAKI